MNFVTGTLIFVAGAGIGSLATYFLVRKHFADIADAEIEDIKEWAKEAVEKKSLQLISRFEEASTRDSSDPEQCGRMISEYTEFLQSLGYSVERDDEEAEADDDSGVNPPDDETGIEVIDENEYTNYHSDYDKVGVTFYAGDHTFVDDNDTPIDTDEAEAAIGKIEDYVPINLIAPDTDALYIRNHDTATDYEVILMPTAFMNS